MNRITKGQKIFNFFNIIFMGIVLLTCLLPLINIVAISLSDISAVTMGKVTFWPVDITTAAYKNMMKTPMFITSFVNVLERVAIGVPVNVFLIVTAAFPLSLGKSRLSFRSFYVWFFIVTILFSGGLIPLYLTVNEFGLINSFWSMILPGAVPVFSVIVMVNFFRGIPIELEEAARIDGSGYWTILWKIYVPCSLPAVATIILFCVVNHWNEWFYPQIFLNKMEDYPLQSYLQIILNQNKVANMVNLSQKELEEMAKISTQTLNAAQIVISVIPILIVYPFLQKYFVAGLTIGGVKG